ncbi:hypothetical protein GCM10009526_24350 [Glutamicibacter creatinolyticus]
MAQSLEQIQKLTPKQRDGVYGTMRPWLNVLSYDKVTVDHLAQCKCNVRWLGNLTSLRWKY